MTKPDEQALRKCALDGCDIVFEPTVYWQIYCCDKHAEKARKIRHRDKVKKAVEYYNNYYDKATKVADQ